MMTRLKRLVFVFVACVLLGIVGLEVTYRIKISQLKPIKPSTITTHSTFSHDALWVSLNAQRQVAIERRSPLHLAMDLIRLAAAPDVKKPLFTGSNVAALVAHSVARNMPKKQQETPQGESHFNNAILTVWVTNHYTTKEALDYLLETLYFGHQQASFATASRFYFAKPHTQLSPSEVLVLTAISISPYRHDPYCKPDKLEKKAHILVRRLQKLNPARYNNLQFKMPAFSKIGDDNC